MATVVSCKSLLPYIETMSTTFHHHDHDRKDIHCISSRPESSESTKFRLTCYHNQCNDDDNDDDDDGDDDHDNNKHVGQCKTDTISPNGINATVLPSSERVRNNGCQRAALST